VGTITVHPFALRSGPPPPINRRRSEGDVLVNDGQEGKSGPMKAISNIDAGEKKAKGGGNGNGKPKVG
jgi:hypothetical protein